MKPTEPDKGLNKNYPINPTAQSCPRQQQMGAGSPLKHEKINNFSENDAAQQATPTSASSSAENLAKTEEPELEIRSDVTEQKRQHLSLSSADAGALSKPCAISNEVLSKFIEARNYCSLCPIKAVPDTFKTKGALKFHLRIKHAKKLAQLMSKANSEPFEDHESRRAESSSSSPPLIIIDKPESTSEKSTSSELELALSDSLSMSSDLESGMGSCAQQVDSAANHPGGSALNHLEEKGIKSSILLPDKGSGTEPSVGAQDDNIKTKHIPIQALPEKPSFSYTGLKPGGLTSLSMKPVGQEEKPLEKVKVEQDIEIINLDSPPSSDKQKTCSTSSPHKVQFKSSGAKYIYDELLRGAKASQYFLKADMNNKQKTGSSSSSSPVCFNLVICPICKVAIWGPEEYQVHLQKHLKVHSSNVVSNNKVSNRVAHVKPQPPSHISALLKEPYEEFVRQRQLERAKIEHNTTIVEPQPPNKPVEIAYQLIRIRIPEEKKRQYKRWTIPPKMVYSYSSAPFQDQLILRPHLSLKKCAAPTISLKRIQEEFRPKLAHEKSVAVQREPIFLGPDTILEPFENKVGHGADGCVGGGPSGASSEYQPHKVHRAPIVPIPTMISRPINLESRPVARGHDDEKQVVPFRSPQSAFHPPTSRNNSALPQLVPILPPLDPILEGKPKMSKLRLVRPWEESAEKKCDLAPSDLESNCSESSKESDVEYVPLKKRRLIMYELDSMYLNVKV